MCCRNLVDVCSRYFAYSQCFSPSVRVRVVTCIANVVPGELVMVQGRAPVSRQIPKAKAGEVVTGKMVGWVADLLVADC
jgi:hypothetical protein